MYLGRVRKRFFAGVFAGTVLFLAGCGAGASVGDGAASSSVAQLTSSLPPGTVTTASVPTRSLGATTLVPPSPLNPAGTLTNADAGSTVHFKVGDTIDIALKAASGFQNWQVATPDPAMLRPTVNPAAAAVRGATLRAFQAVGAGTTEIMATSLPICAAGQACPQIVQGYKVTVVLGN
jgi:hypothetical protein